MKKHTYVNVTKRALISLVMVLLAAFSAGQGGFKFSKENRTQIISEILKDIAKETGGRTAAADSGSGKATSDMDVTCKLVIRRPDGTVDNDLTSRFIEASNKLYPNGDFDLDEHGSIRSKVLDTAIHDAKNAVPDFHCALPYEKFQSKYMESLQNKLSNPDAYFTAGGNKKQVDIRMQSKSRLRMFNANGTEETIIVDKKNKPSEYLDAMKKYFGMNPEEVLSRKHGRDLFGDAYDAYRQSREPEHENEPTRGDAKYNTRILNNLLESNGLPPWNQLKADKKQEVLMKLFPDTDVSRENHRNEVMGILDRSFSIYMGRSSSDIAVSEFDKFKDISKSFQESAIAELSAKRIQDILDPRISMRDMYDHAQALAQEKGKTWSDLSKDERKEFFKQAKENQPDLMKKLKFAASGEMAMVLKNLEHMDSASARSLKENILQKIPTEQREYFSAQMDLARAYMKDTSNRRNNVAAEMETMLELERIQKRWKMDEAIRGEAKEQKAQGLTFRKVLLAAGGTYQAYQTMMEKWDNLKNNLDPSLQKVAGYISALDKTNSMLNLIKVYQETGGNAEAMKRAVYLEAMSRYVPGYSNYQLFKQFNSSDPRVQEEAKKALIFQGLTFLPGGGFAQAVKLSVDVAVTGLQITIGHSLSSLGDTQVQNWLNGTGNFGQSILYEVPGTTIESKRKNLFKYMTGEKGELRIAFGKLMIEKKRWNGLPPYQKDDPAQQKKYQDTINRFYSLAQMKFQKMADNYSADAVTRGNIATGSIEKMTNLLFVDFANGLNEQVTLDEMKNLEEQAKQSNILDEADEYLYGLFSKSIDAVLDKMAGEGDIVDPQNKGQAWQIKFDTVDDDGKVLNSSAQVVPPLDVSFEERNSPYTFSVDDKASGMEMSGTGESFKLKKVKIRFKVVNIKGKVLITKDFIYEPQIKGLFTERIYWDPGQKQLQKEFTYYWRSDGREKIRHGAIKQYYQDGVLQLEGTYKEGQMDGKWIRYWGNGQKYDELNYKEGAREGPYYYWNHKGEQEITGQFKKNRKAGKWSYPFAEGSYEDTFNVVVRSSAGFVAEDKEGEYDGVGNKLGQWTYWNTDPYTDKKYKSKVESYNSEGKVIGTTTEWYSNGQKSSECVYSTNGEVSCKSWDSDGKER